MSSVRGFAILTCSDRCSVGTVTDQSGPFLVELVKGSSPKHVVTETRVVPDHRPTIESVLRQWCDRSDIHCVITTGGTGFTVCDVTPEATKAVIEKEASGIVHALMNTSLKATPMAMLSRLTAGILNHTLIVNFPGSKKACGECFEVLQPVLKHALDQLNSNRSEVDAIHSQMATNDKSKVQLVAVADRDRHSSFEMISMHLAFEKILDQVEHYLQQNDATLTETITADKFDRFTGATLSADVFTQVPLPPFDASIKDGYAVVAEDGTGDRTVRHKASVAGHDPGSSEPLSSGFCARINTGAAVPPGANAVVQVEDTELVQRTQDGEEAVVRIKNSPTVGQDIRRVGSDIAVDSSEPLLCAHTTLGPIEFGLLASTGNHSVSVFCRPSVAIMSTGDEVISPGLPRPPNCIWDSNRVLLRSLLSDTVTDLGIVPDQVDHIYRSIKKALDVADVVITTGGVSMGERDLVKQVLTTDFDACIHFGRVNLKPGKPTTFATCVHNGRLKFIFALPGNPVSAFVTFQVFVRPTLQLLGGKYWVFVRQFADRSCRSLLSVHNTVRCKLTLSKPYKLDSRPEFVRAIVSFSSFDATTHLPTVRLTEHNQISSRLINVKDANALVLLQSSSESDKRFAEDGMVVEAILI